MRKSALIFNNIVWHPELVASHGFSLFTVYDDKKILFDTGSNDLFLKNAKFMNLDLEHSDFVIISHSHYDHSNGLEFLSKKILENKIPLYLPNNFDLPVFSKRGKEIVFVGSSLKTDELKKKFNIKIVLKTTKIADDITILHTEKEINYFEDNLGKKRIKLSENSLIIGNSLIVGCSHFGIIEIVKEALKINPKISLVAGGMHLLKKTNQELEEIAYKFHKLNIKTVYPMHCSGTKISLFLEKYKIKTTLPGVGFSFELD